ncbi:hypothetical protein D1871_08800 [Nakamurella silvestris]|nr:hypothetical protein D1871_08800 [Nakamurella silvestris]
MVVVLLMFLFLSLVQVCLWVYTRNLLVAAAADAARHLARAGDTDGDAVVWIDSHWGDGLAAGTLSTLRCAEFLAAELIEVRCVLTTPGLVSGLDGVLPDISVVAHAVRERS